MVCGNIAGNISDPLRITFYSTESTVGTPNDSLHSIENQGTHNLSTTETIGINSSATSQVYIISFSCLATVFFVGAVASLTVIATFLKRSKVKIRTASVQSNRAEEITHNEPVYGNVTPSPLPSVSAINTQDNVAYGNTRTSTREERATCIQDVPMYEEVTDPISLVSTIDTQDNAAYGCTQQL